MRSADNTWQRGYLKGLEAVCFPGFEEELIEATIKNDKVVTANNFITSKGREPPWISLAIVSVLKDENTAKKIRSDMQAG